MTVPNFSDFKTYVGTKLTNVDWDFNLNKIIAYLTSGSYDLWMNTFKVTANSDMNQNKLLNLADPTLAQDGVNLRTLQSYSMPQNYISGLNLANNITTPYTDIDIAAGIAQDSTNAKGMTLATALTKRLSTAFAAGTGNGMLDAGSIANSTWYHIFLIAKTDGTTDILASTSATNPQLPTGYTYKRRIGSIKTDASSHILAFIQNGDDFLWSTMIQDISASCTTASRTLYTMSAPPVNCWVNIVACPNPVGTGYFLITSPLQLDTVPSDSNRSMCYVGSGSLQNGYTGLILATNSQIGIRTNASESVVVNTIGYKDTRGKN